MPGRISSISYVRRVKPSASVVDVHQHPPGLHEAARRVGFDHLAVDDHVGDVGLPPISARALFMSSLANAR